MHRFLILSLFATTIALGEPETIDRSGAWDVNGPMGPSSTLEFSTDEGTWMSLDVHPDGEQIIFDTHRQPLIHETALPNDKEVGYAAM